MVTAITIRKPGSDDDRVRSLHDRPMSHRPPDVRSGASAPTVFVDAVLPHLDAAYNLACWLTLDPIDAEYLVQDACVQALRCRVSIRRGNERIWLLRIVRDAVYAKLKIKRIGGEVVRCRAAKENDDDGPLLNAAVAALPIELRECLLLREMENFSCREIACITEVTNDVVATRLNWARHLLRASGDQDWKGL